MTGPPSPVAVDVFAQQRPRLFAVAYRLLGSVAEAEDVLQESWIAWQRVDLASVDEPAAYLTTVVTRRCLDVLRSARARRETYVGPWLPEPLVGEAADGGASSGAAEPTLVADSVRMAFLVVLESLSPAERVAFVLHDVFGYGYDELARVLDRSEPACRQLATRARAHVAARRPRFQTDERTLATAVERFLAACLGGDVEVLVAALHPDAELTSDGGGRVTAARRVVVGADRVARFLAGTARDVAVVGAEVVDVNAGPGVVLRLGDGSTTVVGLDVVDGLVRRVHMVRNPDKLLHVRPPADTD